MNIRYGTPLTRVARRALAGACCAVAGVAMAGDFDFDLATAAALSPPPGTVIDAANLEQAAQLIDKEFAELISNGWVTITVGEPVSFDPHQNYVTTTAQNAGQTTLGSAPGVLEGYAGGRPFPGELSTDDPRAGEKLVWNMRYAYGGDGGEIPEMYWQYRDMRNAKIERELEFEASSMRFMYRHVIEPIPEIDDNTYQVYNALTLTALEPGDVA
ncbi:MAG: DUF1329 domain-containing protein, partial [Gammaproteobacteria bacterium]